MCEVDERCAVSKNVTLRAHANWRTQSVGEINSLVYMEGHVWLAHQLFCSVL